MVLSKMGRHTPKSHSSKAVAIMWMEWSSVAANSLRSSGLQTGLFMPKRRATGL